MSLSVILALRPIYLCAGECGSGAGETRGSGDDLVRIPVAEVQDGNLHLFSINVNGQAIGSW